MPILERLTPREVPLGGLRAMPVRRTLPQRSRSLIGAWCFVDHYGPHRVAQGEELEGDDAQAGDAELVADMLVAPHPHTGLQTVSWLFSGEIEHRDSAGNHAMVRPGELNLMTGGSGISHSEVSTKDTRILHGVQLWVALPDASRDAEPGFEHFAPQPVAGDGFEALVFLGSAFGSTSPVHTHTELLGAEVRLDPGAAVRIEVRDDFEHGVLLDSGDVAIEGEAAEPGEMFYLEPGRTSLSLEAGHDPARVILLGGPHFGEPIVMWWNFVGRTHEEIVGFRAEWQRQIHDDAGEVFGDASHIRDGRFGIVTGDHLEPIPAPALPNARLKQRT